MAWSREQKRNAAIIVEVGQNLGASRRDIVIALMTAMQESTLRNLDYGDRDSLGLFQQRNAWGTRAQRLDPRKATRMFFQGGHGGQRGLFDFSTRDNMSLTQAAQSVQVSAYPDAYAKWEDEARSLLGVDIGAGIGLDVGTGGDLDKLGKGAANRVRATQDKGNAMALEDILGGGSDDARYTPAVEQTDSGSIGVGAYSAPMSLDQVVQSSMMDSLPNLRGNGRGGGGGLGGMSDEDVKRWRRRVAKISRRFLGTPYVWGGTTPDGFDCSGFVQYVYKKLGVDLPRISYQQAESGKRIGLNNLKVGDLVAWNNSSRNPGADHIAIYLGNGKIIEAPRPGSSVQISDLYDQGNAWGVRMKL